MQRAYVALMMQIVGRGMVSARRRGAVMRAELSALPAGYRIAMSVAPAVPRSMVEALDRGAQRLRRASLVLSFQEGAARAFAWV